MKRIAFILLFFLITPSALADWFYNSEGIVAEIGIYGSAEVVPTAPSGYIDTATINMTFFPKQTDTQDLLKLNTNPMADFTGNSLKFTFRKPQGKFDFRATAEVRTSNTFPEIGRKVKFPIDELSKDIAVYTLPSETIDSGNEDIARLASELVKGEDDLYAAVFRIADWTKSNIQYNLSTLTADVSQKASWVLENREGVCDELTSLFIALLRSVGIPARFVSGIAYTNSELFPDNWGAHGWAEVYFPGYGWVPFDVTYGEYGWIDPTHIKFKESVDSDEPSTYYSWLGRNADLKTGELDIKTGLKEKIGYFKTPLNLDAEPLSDSIGFNSYNLVTATLENLNDFYYATELRLSKPNEIEIMGSEQKSILLLPKEKKKVFWILRLEGQSLSNRYVYTFPLLVSTTNNITFETSFTSSSREKTISLQEAESAARLLEEEKEKEYSGNVLLNCSLPKNEFYEYENIEISCHAKNTGNVFLDDLDVCFQAQCKKIDLGISQSKSVVFAIENPVAAVQNAVTLRNELVSKAFYPEFRVNDAPEIDIGELEFPASVGYSDNFSVSFALVKKSRSNPKNVEVVFSQNGLEKKWSMNELAENRKFVLSLAGRQLRYGKNDFRINVVYYDGLGKQYNADKEFSMQLGNVNFWQRLLLSFNNFEGAGLEAVTAMLFGIAIIFIAVIGWLWRRKGQ